MLRNADGGGVSNFSGKSITKVQGTHQLHYILLHHFTISAFEIALVRLSETSDYLLGQVNNPLAVIRRTSGNFQPYFMFHYYNAVIERQNTSDFTLEDRQRSRCFATRCRKNNMALTSVICCIVVGRKLLYLLWLYY